MEERKSEKRKENKWKEENSKKNKSAKQVYPDVCPFNTENYPEGKLQSFTEWHLVREKKASILEKNKNRNIKVRMILSETA